MFAFQTLYSGVICQIKYFFCCRYCRILTTPETPRRMDGMKIKLIELEKL